MIKVTIDRTQQELKECHTSIALKVFVFRNVLVLKQLIDNLTDRKKVLIIDGFK